MDSICKHLNFLTPSTTSHLHKIFNSKCLPKQQCEVTKSACQVQYRDLWLCLEPLCGFVGCSRQTHRHAEAHFVASSHALVMKLSTMELWCYNCTHWVGSIDRHKVEGEKVRKFQNVLKCGHEETANRELELNVRRQRERAFSSLHKKRTRVSNILSSSMGDSSTDKRDLVFLIDRRWYQNWENFVLGGE